MLNKVICALAGHRMIVRWKGYQLTCPACLRCDKANPNWTI